MTSKARLVCALLVAIVAALFAVPPPALASPSTPTRGTFAYDGHYTADVFVNTMTERGPPIGANSWTSNDAVDLGPDGASAHREGAPFGSATPCYAVATLAQFASDMAATGGQVLGVDRDRSSRHGLPVAANGGAAAVRMGGLPSRPTWVYHLGRVA